MSVRFGTLLRIAVLKAKTGSVRGGDSFRIVTLSRRINKGLTFN